MFKDSAKNFFRLLVIASFFVLLFLISRFFDSPQTALAATGVPHIINYQGKLAGPTGTAVTNGGYNFRFSLYTTATGGSPIWQERWYTTSTNVTTTAGIFSVDLGSITSLANVDFTQDTYYLQVDFDPEPYSLDHTNVNLTESFSPRKRIGSSLYALNAEVVTGYATTTASTSTKSYIANALKIATTTEADGQSLVVGGRVYIGSVTASNGQTPKTTLYVKGAKGGYSDSGTAGDGAEIKLYAGDGGEGESSYGKSGGKGGNFYIAAGNGGLGHDYGAGGNLYLFGGNSAGFANSPQFGGSVYISGGTSDVSEFYGNVILAQSAGKVGIGTDSPTSKLYVNGDSYFNGITTVAGDLNISGSFNPSAINNNLVKQLEGGLYYGRIRVTENPWDISNPGVNWVARGPSGIWRGIAMSSDGMYQTAVTNGYIYTSTDYGISWTARDSSRQWMNIAMSSDGKYQTAVVESGQIYTSADYGVSWTARDSDRGWTAVAMSSDGKYQTATDIGIDDPGYIYTSADYGVSWTARDSNRYWTGIAMSSDGKYQTATDNGFGGPSYIYTSTDYGVTWTARDSSREWADIAMSSDGKYQTADVFNGQIYTSTDYGVTWTARESSRIWRGIAMSSDGKYQTAVANGYIYTSTDYGVSWTARDSNRNWFDVAMSSDGKYQTAVDLSGHQIYTSYADSYIYGGNLGVGTTTPSSKLEVAGGLKVSGDATTTGSFVMSGLTTNASATYFVCLDNTTGQLFKSSTDCDGSASPFLISLDGVPLSEILANQWKIEASSVNRIDGYDGTTPASFVLGSYKEKETDYIDSLSLQLRCVKDRVVTIKEYPLTFIGKLDQQVKDNWLTAAQSVDGIYFQALEGDNNLVSFTQPQEADWASCDSHTFAFKAFGYYEWERPEFDAERTEYFWQKYSLYKFNPITLISNVLDKIAGFVANILGLDSQTDETVNQNSSSTPAVINPTPTSTPSTPIIADDSSTASTSASSASSTEAIETPTAQE